MASGVRAWASAILTLWGITVGIAHSGFTMGLFLWTALGTYWTLHWAVVTLRQKVARAERELMGEWDDDSAFV